jgi:drug/metabolite transporter (DMT)-like permease
MWRVIGWPCERQTDVPQFSRISPVIPFEWYWAIFVLVAAVAQTVRNATQRKIAGTAGTLGATYARFIYAWPFAAAFLGALVAARGLPALPGPDFAGWAALGGLTQVLATACLLAAMQQRSFSFAIALSNTSPVQVSIFGLLILGEPLTVGLAASVLLVTAGTMLISWPRAGERPDLRSVALGLGSAFFFSLASVAYRGAALSLHTDFLMAAMTTLFATLTLQSILLSLWMVWRAPEDLRAVFRNWRQSLLAGFTGALASGLWFSAYAIETVARVRTLAVIEILFAQVVSSKIFREGAGMREFVSLALIVLGIIVVVNA